MSNVAKAGSFVTKGRTESMRTLIIGDVSRWASEGRDIAGTDNVTYAGVDEVSRALLQSHDPEIILSPLVADSFDAFDVAAILADAQFTGRYRAVSHPTIAKAVIMSEIAQIAPELDFDIIEIK
jgi:hypothetical protein